MADGLLRAGASLKRILIRESACEASAHANANNNRIRALLGILMCPRRRMPVALEYLGSVAT
jgi:hypothetical protein